MDNATIYFKIIWSEIMGTLIYDLKDFDCFDGKENKLINSGDVLIFSINNPPYRTYKKTFKLFYSSQQIHFANDDFGNCADSMYKDEYIDYIAVRNNIKFLVPSFGDCGLRVGATTTLYGVIRFNKKGIYTAKYNESTYNITVEHNEKNIENKFKNFEEFAQYYNLDCTLYTKNLCDSKFLRQCNTALFTPEYNNMFPNDKSVWHTIKKDQEKEMMYSYKVDNTKNNDIWSDFTLSYLNGRNEIPITFKIQPSIDVLPQPWENEYVAIKNIVMYDGPCNKPMEVEKNNTIYFVIITFKKQGVYIMRKISKNDFVKTYYGKIDKLLLNSIITIE